MMSGVPGTRVAAPPRVNLDWQRRAHCAGTPDDRRLFASSPQQQHRAVQDICRFCTVTVECGAYAIHTGQEFGVWGGLTEREINALRRKLVAS